jgi:16S rRNA (cytosine967-C5)-methyltransferase
MNGKGSAMTKLRQDDGTGARAAAVALLDRVLGQGEMLSQVMADSAVVMAGLDGPERARAQRLALATLRRIGPADAVLAPMLRRKPALTVQNILRLALTELAEGAAAHGVVNAAVTLAGRDRRTAAAKGLVNAVLRRLPPEALAAQKVQMLPRWLRQPLVHHWGRDVVAAIEAAHAAAPPVDLSLRKRPAPSAAESPLAGDLPEGLLLPSGSLRLYDPGQISALAGYERGAWWVQDAAAAMAVPLLAPRPGERVLDLCAAPGGKTLQLAAAGAKVTALDISDTRLERLRDNLERCQLNAEVLVADALDWVPPYLFDAILLDAPCSATGTIRRHPELPFVRDGAEIEALAALQSRLIDRARAMLAPGGRLVFCTCSLLAAEGEEQLKAALERHPDLRVIRPGDDQLSMPWVAPEWVTPGGGLRLRPDHWADMGGMDGIPHRHVDQKLRRGSGIAQVRFDCADKLRRLPVDPPLYPAAAQPQRLQHQPRSECQRSDLSHKMDTTAPGRHAQDIDLQIYSVIT